MCKKILWLGLMLAAGTPVARADVLLLKGGQRLEGEVADKGGLYEIKTDFGTLTISKVDVEKYVKGIKGIEAEGEDLHQKARTLYEEALKIQNDPKATNAKLKAGVDLLRQAVQMYSDARETYSGEKYTHLDDAPIKMLQEMRLYRDKMTSDLAGSPPSLKVAEKAQPVPLKPEPPPPLTGEPKVAEKAPDLASLIPKAKGGDGEASFVLGVYYHEKEHNLPEALKWYQTAAEKNHAKSADKLGDLYDRGRGGIREDAKEAFKWFSKAEGLGLALAQYHLGMMFYYGRGCAKSIEKADAWCEKALPRLRVDADLGDPESLVALGLMYRSGLGLAPDKAKHLEYFRKAADQGYAFAQNYIGAAYQRGKYVEKNDGEAIVWYQKAAEQGLALAQTNLGWIYSDWGLGTTATTAKNPNMDDEKSFYWYRKAAAQGDAWGLFDLGFCYSNGKGVPKDEKEGMKCYQLALKTANDECRRRTLHNIGYCYENGLGVKKDPQEAMRHYRIATDLGYSPSQHGLGYLTETVLKNSKEAFKWYMMAAKQGLPEAQTNVGNCYWNGRGVKKDLDEAEKWLVMAAQHGQPQGIKYLEQVRTEKASQPSKKP